VGLVLFACRSDACRLSSRNRQIAAALNERGFATLLLNLLSPHEGPGRADSLDVESLSGRLVAASQWAMTHPKMEGLPVGYLSASAAAVAALCAAAELGDSIGGIVSRGGCSDVTCDCLGRVRAPTLLILGANHQARALNERLADRLWCHHELREIPGATHVFDEPGAPDRVARLTADWFTHRFTTPSTPAVQGEPVRPRLPAAVGKGPTGASGGCLDDRHSDWAYIPWTRVKSKGGSRWLAS
jgi:putative phosphoribosyl transferase